MTTHRIPLHSGEPRAQHAPRAPDGCLLPSLQPRPHNLHPPTPLTPSCAVHTSILQSQCLCPTMDRSLSLSLSDARTYTHRMYYTNCITLTKLYTHNTWSLRSFSVGTPYACFFRVLVVSVQLKQRNKPFSPPCLKLYAAIVSFSLTPGYFSVQAIMRCLFIKIMDDETQSSICWWWCRMFVWKSTLSGLRPQAFFERVLC